MIQVSDKRPLTWQSPSIAEWANELKYPHLALAGFPYSPTFSGSTVNVILPWNQRLLILVSGRMTVKTTIQCEHELKNMRTSSHCYVHWPMMAMNALLWWRLRADN